MLYVVPELLKLFTSKLHFIDIKYNGFLLLHFLFLLFLLSSFLNILRMRPRFFRFNLYYFPSHHTLCFRRILYDKSSQLVLTVQIPNKRTRITFASDFISNNLHVHLRKPTLRTANVFINKFVQDLS